MSAATQSCGVGAGCALARAAVCDAALTRRQRDRAAVSTHTSFKVSTHTRKTPTYPACDARDLPTPTYLSASRGTHTYLPTRAGGGVPRPAVTSSRSSIARSYGVPELERNMSEACAREGGTRRRAACSMCAQHARGHRQRPAQKQRKQEAPSVSRSRLLRHRRRRIRAVHGGPRLTCARASRRGRPPAPHPRAARAGARRRAAGARRRPPRAAGSAAHQPARPPRPPRWWGAA